MAQVNLKSLYLGTYKTPGYSIVPNINIDYDKSNRDFSKTKQSNSNTNSRFPTLYDEPLVQ